LSGKRSSTVVCGQSWQQRTRAQAWVCRLSASGASAQRWIAANQSIRDASCRQVKRGVCRHNNKTPLAVGTRPTVHTAWQQCIGAVRVDSEQDSTHDRFRSSVTAVDCINGVTGANARVSTLAVLGGRGRVAKRSAATAVYRGRGPAGKGHLPESSCRERMPSTT
jgi:hypothetical protein